jgi:hypothetical protein
MDLLHVLLKGLELEICFILAQHHVTSKVTNRPLKLVAVDLKLGQPTSYSIKGPQ